MVAPARRQTARPVPFARLSGPEKLRRLLHSFPAEAAAIVCLIEFIWHRKLAEIRRPR